MDLDSLGFNFRDGIYYSNKLKPISYPDEGNDICYQVEDDSFWFNHRNNCIAHLVKLYSRHSDFWDVGGGNGIVSKRLQEEGFDTVMIEPGIKGALNAKNRGVEYIICGILEDVEFNQFMGNVGLFDVVEHIEDDLGFLKSIKLKMRDGAHLFVTVPAYQLLWSNEDVDAGHYRRYTGKSMSKLMEKAGYKVIFSTYLFWPLPIPIFLKRTLTSLLSSKNISKDSTENEHRTTGIMNRIVIKLLEKEFLRIKNGTKVVFGSSCLIVGKTF